MSKKRKSQTSRSSNDMYSRLSDPSDEDSRFKIKLGQSRKKLRKLQRKDAKRIKHEKKLEWIKRRKMNKNNNVDNNGPSIVNTKKIDNLSNGNNLKSIYKNGLSKSDNSDIKKKVRIDTGDNNKNPDELEIEYLENQLLKNKRNHNGRKVDALQELKSEFIKDGFDEDFLDFLSNITRIGEKEKVLDNDELYEEDTTFVKHRSSTFQNGSIEDEDIESEDGEDEDVEEIQENEEEMDAEEAESEDEMDEGIISNEQEEENDSEEEFENEENVQVKEKYKKRETNNEESIDSIDDIRRKQIGLVNRLSEGNYKIILNQVCEMYSNFITKSGQSSNPKRLSMVLNELFGDLCDLIIKMIIDEVNVVISLVATQSALICSLSNHFNSSILKIFLNKLFQILEINLKLLNRSNGNNNIRGGNNRSKSNTSNTDSKLVIRNIIISITSLFYYKLIDIDIVFHLIRILTKDELSEDILQLLLILLKYSGYNISKNSDIIKYLNELIQKYKQDHSVITNKLKYIEEELNRNKRSNNVFDQFDYLKNLINSKLNMNRIVVNLDMLKNYDINNVNGINGDNNNIDSIIGIEKKKKETKKDELIKKATEIGLNKDIQKTLFICIMNSISPENAMNNILQVNIKNSQEYNYYYIKILLLLTSKLNMSITKRYKKYINNNIVLYLKNFENLSQNQCLLLSKLLYHMIINKIVRLRVLNFLNVSSYGTNGFKTFINELFGSLVSSSKGVDQNEDEVMEEYLIQELLSIQSEKYFVDLSHLWSKFIERHCLKEVSKANSTILFKSYQHVFNS